MCDKPNGYVSDYDILVIVNKAALAEEDLVWHRAEEQIDRRVTSAPLGLIVHDIKDINQRLHEGQYFFKDIRAEGIEIFASTPKPLAQPGNLTVEEQRVIAQKYLDQWLRKVRTSPLASAMAPRQSLLGNRSSAIAPRQSLLHCPTTPHPCGDALP